VGIHNSQFSIRPHRNSNFLSSKTVTHTEVAVDIASYVKVDLPAIQDSFSESKVAIVGANPKLKERL